MLRDKAFLDGRRAQLGRYAHLLLLVLNETKLMPDQKVEEFFGFATAVKIKPDDFDRKYAILDVVLGKGTFGEVRLGENRQTKEKVRLFLLRLVDYFCFCFCFCIGFFVLSLLSLPMLFNCMVDVHRSINAGGNQDHLQAAQITDRNGLHQGAFNLCVRLCYCDYVKGVIFYQFT